MVVPPFGSIPGSNVVGNILERFLTSRDGSRDEEPGEWQYVERTPARTIWCNNETQQLVICNQQYKDTEGWIARAEPALIDGEEVDLSLTAGPTSREIAEFLARQYMAHDLVLAPITAMQSRQS